MIKEYGYEYDAVLNRSIWEETRGKTIQASLFGGQCLRSGRDALKAIAREYSSRIVYLPALSCDSMVFPFEMYGHTVKYYRLHNDYSIDIDSIPKGEEPAFLLYMDYFGLPAINDHELELTRSKRNIIFIEDRTHNLIQKRLSIFQPDYIIASLRKWIPVPDGGLLWGGINKSLASDVSFANQRLKAQCMRHQFFQCGDESIKTEYRKIFSEVSNIMEKDEPSAMSAYSYELAAKTDWGKVRTVRQGNASTLISILQSSPHINIIQTRTGLSDLYVAFTIKNRDAVQRQLSKKGIFNTIIWPLSEEQKNICSVAKFTEENMLAAPCDQRYTADDMKYIGNEIVRVANEING